MKKKFKSNYEQYQDYADKIADIFYQALENDNLKFTKRWKAGDLQSDIPHNPQTRTVYKGVNSLILEAVKHEKAYEKASWLTYKQVKDLGGTIKRGEKGTPISFFKVKEETKEETDPTSGEIKTTVNKTPIFKQSYVFNIEQTLDIPQEKINELIENGYDKINFMPIENVENILKKSKIEIEHVAGSSRAYYQPSTDKIYLPQKEQFRNIEAYYSTALHELGHATGHKTRLDRSYLIDNYTTDITARAKEELRAELYSYIQARELGIDYELENHQSYVKSWISILKDDRKQLVEAVKDSLKMVKYVNANYIQEKGEYQKDLTQEQEINLKPLLQESALQQKEITNEEARELYKISKVVYEELNENKRIRFVVQNKLIIADKQNDKYTLEDLKQEHVLNEKSKDFKTQYSIIKDLRQQHTPIQKETKDLTQKEDNKHSYSYHNYPKIPLNQVLENLGYDVVRSKSSKNSISMTNGSEKLVITREPNEHYLYFNAEDKKDKGNIFTFAKNRGINNIKSIIANTKIDMSNHLILHNNSQVFDMNFGEEFKGLQNINEVQKNYMTEVRKVNSKIISDFDLVKTNKFGNALFPTYTLEKIQDKNGKDYESLQLSGYVEKLKKPMLKDKNGKLHEKPINSLERGKTGLAILQTDEKYKGVDGVEGKRYTPRNIKELVIGENMIDSISYKEYHKKDFKTVLMAFNGSMKENGIKALKYILSNNIYPNLEKITLAYDNDKDGVNYDNKTKELIKQSIKKEIEINVDKSKSKDWNEELKLLKKAKEIDLSKYKHEKKNRVKQI